MLRFASSPTRDMNIGDLRLALLNSIVAKQKGEDLIVRIEDLDKEKNIEGKDQEILDILNLFGIEYSQVIYQSQNLKFHSAMALQLMHEKKAFSCFCSDEWLNKKRLEAKENKQDYKYDDACANLPAELVIDNLNPFTIRLKKPENFITVKDVIQGEMKFTPENMDSFLIMTQEKMPIYNFACAVDDMLNDISIVIHSDDNLEDTPRQEHIRASLQYNKKIEYAHLPNILDTTSVKSLLEEGFLPEAILNYLVSIGNKELSGISNLSDAQALFDLKNISRSPLQFNINELKAINHKHLQNLDNKELSRYVGFADEEIGALAKVYLEEASTTKELRTKIKPIFAEKVIPKELQNSVKILIEAIKSAPYFDKYDDFKNYVIKESELDEKSFIQTLRLVLTGADNGPDIALIYKYLKNYIGEIVK